MIFSDKQLLILLGVGAVTAWYLSSKAVDVAKDVGQAINPINHDNIFNQGANSLFQAITGDTQNTIGTWIYEKLHPNEGL